MVSFSQRTASTYMLIPECRSSIAVVSGYAVMVFTLVMILRFG